MEVPSLRLTWPEVYRSFLPLPKQGTEVFLSFL